MAELRWRPWLACRQKAGYGFSSVDGKVAYAHRVAFDLSHPNDPVGKQWSSPSRLRTWPPSFAPGHWRPPASVAVPLRRYRFPGGRRPEFTSMRSEREAIHKRAEAIRALERGASLVLDDRQRQRQRAAPG